uniref:Tetratricopeptide repeat protein n=1 Tax=Plectus sambesii TaxID=2011161 RepID=A0A914WQJ4_9BILA
MLIVPFLPASNLFFRVGFVLAERVLYLPSIGFCFLLAIALSLLAQSSQNHTSWLNRYSKALIAALVFLWTIKSIERSSEWRTEKDLYRSGAAVCPQNAKIHYNLGKVLTDGGLELDAVAKYREALKLNPMYDHAMNNLANLLQQRGEYAEAERLLLRAVQVRADFAAAWMNLGIVQTALGRWVEAETAYHTALGLRSPYPDCLFNMGNLYVTQNRQHEALACWRNATRVKPQHAKAWINQMILLDNIDDCEAAVHVGREALQYVVDEPGVHFSLGSCLGKLSRFEDAEQSLAAAIRLDPLNAPYYGNLGVLYHRWGKFDRAEASYRRALELDSGLVGIQKHLEQLVAATKANDSAKTK